jgi:hypothetical protein
MVKGKVRPRIGHEGAEVEQTYSSTLSLTSVLGGAWVVNATPRPLYRPERRSGTPCVGGWVGPRAGLYRCGKSLITGTFLYSFVLCISSVLVSLSWLFCILPFVFTYNTNIHAPAGIRTRNPIKRSAADPCFKPLGHWDLWTFQLLASRFTDWTIAAHL